MNKFKLKITNRKGSAVLYALLVLLVVASVAAVIVTAAMANTGRIENRTEEEQLYLAAESAVEILSNDWDCNLGCAFVGLDTGWEDYWRIEGDKAEQDRTIPFSDYFASLAKAVLNGTAPPADRGIRFSFREGADNLRGITITGTISAPNYTVASGKRIKAGDNYNDYLTVKCIIKASYDENAMIPPYSMELTMSSTSSFMYSNYVAYSNWQVNSVKQGEVS